MGGNALSDCVVFGVTAGREAAAFAHKAAGLSIPDGAKEDVEKQIGRWLGTGSESGKTPRELKKRLAHSMMTDAGIVRSQEQLDIAEKNVRMLEKEAHAAMSCSNANDVMRAFEVINLLSTAKLVIRGASDRKESRGSHYREDCPETDDVHWQRTIRSDEFPPSA
jgi:succinate dehydrogenase/fumarate reductase flavoprotein subunit